MISTKISSIPKLVRCLYWAIGALLLIALMLSSSPVLAIRNTEPAKTIGDPLPRIQCPPGYVAKIYAEGLSAPDGLAFSPTGLLHVAEETTTGQVGRIESGGTVTPILAGLDHPEGIAFDNAGNLYVVEDVPGGRLLKMAPDGTTTTLATDLDAPEGVVWTADGTIYLTESDLQGLVAGTVTSSDYRTRVTAVSSVGGVTTPTLVSTLPWSYAGITLGPDGLLYVTNEASGIGTTNSIFTVNPTTGTRTLFASDLISPEGLRFAANGGFPLYVAEEDTGGGAGRISRVEADGSHSPFCTGFYSIEDVITDATGRLYVSEDATGLIIVIEPQTPHGIILFIGDGMGEAHRTAARWSAVGQDGLLAMDNMPVAGWSSTASADDPITDSAAGGTALATGVKTNNGMIGQDPDGNDLTTILERAQAKGMAVGLVSNTQMAHATPASFAAHVPSRNMMTEIASQMLAARVDVLLAGGEDEFLPQGTAGCYPEDGERLPPPTGDGRNLINEAIAADYTYVCNETDFNNVDPASTTWLLGLFADEGMDRPFSPSLAEMTQKAIDILSQNPNGFFLMVEGGQIDWESHANDATDTITDTVGFDEAVAVGLAYASTVSNTLVIVTADHETGGMSVSLEIGQQGPFSMPDETHFYVNWTTTTHTAADVPVTAQGPWSELLIGSYENTHVHDVMCIALESARGDVTGHLFQDTNGNGGQDPGEPGLIDVTVVITGSLGATQTVTTDSNGDYLITVPMGNTILDVDDSSLPAGYVLTTANDPQVVTVTACKITVSDDVGYQPQGQVAGHLFKDVNGNGIQDSEPDLTNVTVIITVSLGAVHTATTDTSGDYTVTVPTGDTTLDVDDNTLPAGYVLTTANDPQMVTVTAGNVTVSDEVGYQPQGQVTGHLFKDTDGDGVQDPQESDLAGVDIVITDTLGQIQTVTSNATNGDYSVTVPEGNTTLDIDDTTLPPAHVLTTANDPQTVIAVAGTTTPSDEVGYQPQNASIGDRVWYDADGDGLQDGSETDGLANVTIFLDLDSSGTRDPPDEPFDTTDTNGAYDITGLAVGVYTVTIQSSTIPPGYDLTTSNNPLVVTLTEGETYTEADFGFDDDPENASIGDYVWHDINGDRVQDGTEVGLSGVTVFLDFDNNGIRDPGEPFDTTDTNGAYHITGLAAGIYTVTVQSDTIPVGYNLTTANNPLVVTLAESEDYNEADFGFSPPPQLSITKTAMPVGGPVEPGDWITYTITVVNNGGLVGNVVISDSLDLSKVALVTSQTTTGALTNSNPMQVTGFSLNTGQGVTLTLGVTVTITSATTITNIATVDSDQTTLQESNPVSHSAQEAGSGSNTNSVYLPLVIKE
jgi:alkaline phosphatase